MLERLGGADRVQTAEQLAQSIELVEVARLRCPAATAREQGKAKARVLEQAGAVVDHRRHYRYVALGEFEGEAVFFEDGFVGPALGTVELGDQRFAIFDADLVHAIFIAVERQNAGVAEKTDAFYGVEDQIRGQCFKRVRHAHSCAQQAAA